MKGEGLQYADPSIAKECQARYEKEEKEIRKLVDGGASAREVATLASDYLYKWCQDLWDYKYRVSRRGYGRHHDWDQIRAIRAKRADGMTIRAIAAALKCSTATAVKYCRCDDQGNYAILPDVLPYRDDQGNYVTEPDELLY